MDRNQFQNILIEHFIPRFQILKIILVFRKMPPFHSEILPSTFLLSLLYIESNFTLVMVILNMIAMFFLFGFGFLVFGFCVFVCVAFLSK